MFTLDLAVFHQVVNRVPPTRAAAAPQNSVAHLVVYTRGILRSENGISEQQKQHPESAAPPPDYFEATANLPAPASVYPVAGVAAFRPPQAVALPGSSPQVQVVRRARMIHLV